VNKGIAILLLMMIISFFLLVNFKQRDSDIELTNKDYSLMNNLLKNYTPRCVGRYLVSLPEGFNLSDELVTINKQQVEVKRMYLPAFKQRVKLREKELENTNVIHNEDSPFLKKIHSLPDGMTGVIFETNYSEAAPDWGRKLEAHLYDNGVAFKQTIDAKDFNSPRYINEINKNPEYYRSNLDKKLLYIKDFLSSVHGREKEEVPREAGLCIPNGFISGVSHGDEEISLSYKSKAVPNLFLNFESDSFLQEEKSMLERESNISRLLSGNKIKTLMKGERDINKLKAEEWLTINGGEGSGNIYVFTLNINEKNGSPTTPFLRVTLKYRFLSDGDLSEKEIIEFWKKVTNTIRIRTNHF